MTQDELDTLPETGGFGRIEKIIDGKTVFIPVQLPSLALWQKEDDPHSIIGSNGTRYMVGWANGIRYKTALPTYWADLKLED